MPRLSDLVGVPRWLWRSVVRIALWHAVFVASVTMLKSASNAVFLARADPRDLPLLYVAVAVAVALVTSALSRLLSRQSVRRAFSFGVIASALLLGVAVVAAELHLPGAPATLYVLGEVTTTASSILFWARVTEAFSVRDQKRLVGIVSAGGMAGAVLGGVAIRALAAPVGVLPPVAVGVVLTVAALPLFRQVRARARRVHADPGDLAAGLRYVSHARYPIGVALLVVLFAATGATADFVFRLAAATSGSEAEMAGLFGVLNAVVGAAVVLFQAAFTARLLERVGIFAFAALVPILLVITAIVAAITEQRFEALVVMKGIEMAGAFSLYQSAVTLLYNPMPTAVRAQVRAVIDGAVKKGGAALAGLLLAGLAAFAPGVVGPLLVGGLALLAVLELPWLRAQYLRALHDKLGRRKRRAGPRSIDYTDRETQRALLAALDGGEADRMVAALHALEPGFPLGTERLARLLSHEDDGVRQLALARVDEGDRHLAPTLAQMVRREAARRPRAEAVRALARVSKERLLRALEDLLHDDDPGVVAAAIEVGLAHDTARARERLDALVARLRTRDAAWRREIARLLGRLDDARYDATLARLLDDPEESVQRVAIEAAGRERHEAHLHKLIALVEHRALRAAARGALVAYGDAAVSALSVVLDDQRVPLALRIHVPRVLAAIGSEAAARALLFSNPRDDAYLQRRIADRLVEVAEKDRRIRVDRARSDEAIGRRLVAARAYTRVEAELAGLDDERLSLLRRVVDERRVQNLRIAFQLLGLHRGMDRMMTVFRGLVASEARTSNARQDAIELLDATLTGDPLRADFLSLLESELPLVDAGRAEDRVVALCRSKDPLVRGVARRTLRSLGRSLATQEGYVPLGPGAEELEGHDMPDQLIERLFLLEHVDLFEGIAVDDLAAIASIAVEASFDAGQVIYREADQGDSMFVIVEGEVELTKRGRHVLHLAQGETLGQVSFLDRGPRPVTASVAGSGPARLLVIERGALLDLLTDRPGLMHALFSVLAQRLRALIDRDAEHD